MAIFAIELLNVLLLNVSQDHDLEGKIARVTQFQFNCQNNTFLFSSWIHGGYVWIKCVVPVVFWLSVIFHANFADVNFLG